jgi:hypothetical protein
VLFLFAQPYRRGRVVANQQIPRARNQAFRNDKAYRSNAYYDQTLIDQKDSSIKPGTAVTFVIGGGRYCVAGVWAHF